MKTLLASEDKLNEKDKKILEEIFGPLNKNAEKWKCNWIKCVYGMGLAGLGRCIIGNPLDKNCPNFEDEDYFLETQEEYSKTGRTENERKIFRSRPMTKYY